MGDWLQDDKHDAVVGRPHPFGLKFHPAAFTMIYPPLTKQESTYLDMFCAVSSDSNRIFYSEPQCEMWPQPKPGESIAIKFERRSGWRLAVQRPRLFWAHWRLMKFRVRSINAAFRLAMV